MLNDMKELSSHSFSIAPVHICEDARRLSKVPNLGLDALITSPPYPNGTNYIRNTKLELWFLGYIKSASDLNLYRHSAITSGINNVRNDNICDNKDVKRVVAELEKHKYDNRIPKIVSAYFSDIQKVFSSCVKHLESGAKIAIDIGDSRYNSVYVPTDKLFVSVLSSIGYKHIETIDLRKRHSNDGTELKQSLLVFDYKNG